MAKKMGADEARRIGDAHENYPENPQCEKDMDQHNNAVGRRTGSSGLDCESTCSATSELRDKPQGPCTPCGRRDYYRY